MEGHGRLHHVYADGSWRQVHATGERWLLSMPTRTSELTDLPRRMSKKIYSRRLNCVLDAMNIAFIDAYALRDSEGQNGYLYMWVKKFAPPYFL